MDRLPPDTFGAMVCEADTAQIGNGERRRVVYRMVLVGPISDLEAALDAFRRP